jgi:hypothetical protein
MKGLLAGGMILALVMCGGCRSTGEPARDFTPTLARFFLETTEVGAAAVELPISGVRVTIGTKPVFTEGDVVDVDLVQVELGKCLMFQLTPTAARDLYRLTGSSQGRRLVLMLNQVPVGARRIDAPLADGRVLIFAEISDAALPVLVTNLKKTTAELQRAVARRG